MSSCFCIAGEKTNTQRAKEAKQSCIRRHMQEGKYLTCYIRDKRSAENGRRRGKERTMYEVKREVRSHDERWGVCIFVNSKSKAAKADIQLDGPCSDTLYFTGEIQPGMSFELE